MWYLSVENGQRPFSVAQYRQICKIMAELQYHLFDYHTSCLCSEMSRVLTVLVLKKIGLATEHELTVFCLLTFGQQNSFCIIANVVLI